MGKLLQVSRGGFFEKAIDLLGIYGASNGDATDPTVAVVGVGANDQAAMDSSIAPLGSNGVYKTTSGVGANDAFIRTNGYSRVCGTVFANQAGTLNVDWSSDGVNVDYTDTVAVTASTGTKFSLEVVAPYASIRYVNGATGQTTFRLFAWLRRAGAA